MKKFFAMVLALAMVLSLAVPVMAAGENHTIIINKADPDHIYGAYQIFAGDVDTLTGSSVLTHITWGSGIDSVGFLGALKTEFPNIYGNANTADDVANLLGLNNTADHVNAFADLAGEYLIEDSGIPSNYVPAEGTTAAHYEITGLDAGYYLVKDEVGLTGVTMTDYLLKLVEDTSITPKDGYVTVEKNILEGESVEKIGDFVIGKPITFELYSQLPDRYELFDKFYFEFHDTMSPGLTYSGPADEVTGGRVEEDLDNGFLVVEFINGSQIQEVDPSDYTVLVSAVVDSEGEPTGETALEIIFEDMKALEAKYTLHSRTRIYVRYSAFLNDDAIIGLPGNPNEVYVEYSNNPNDDGHGTTIKDEVYALTFALDLTKINGENQTTLAGVGFKLYTDVLNFDEYAIVDLDPDNDITDYTIVGWTTNEEEATELFTGEDGTFTVYGLDEGIYFLKETTVPEGFDGISDIMITITSDYENGELISLKISYGSVVDQGGNLDDGSVDITIENNPGTTLPSTGGIGTTLFYVFGSVMLIGSVVLLVTKKRMSFEA